MPPSPLLDRPGTVGRLGLGDFGRLSGLRCYGLPGAQALRSEGIPRRAVVAWSGRRLPSMAPSWRVGGLEVWCGVVVSGGGIGA